MSATVEQIKTLKAVEAGKVTYDEDWCLAYDSAEINGSSLASCRRRGWVQRHRESRSMFVTAEGLEVLDRAELKGGSSGEG